MSKVCFTCHQPFDKRGAKYCSVKCYRAAPKFFSAEARKNISAALRGRAKPWLRGDRNPNWSNKSRGGRRVCTGTASKLNKTAYVYTVTNRGNGALYVGSTTDVNGRWTRHLYRALSGWTGWLYSAMRKYGPDTFEFEVLETWPTEAEAREAESWFIAYLKSLGASLYNMTTGGEGTSGRVVSQETRDKIARGRMGKPLSLETKAKIAEASRKHRHSAEARRRISEAQKGRTSVWKGKRLSTEHREKQRLGALKRWEHRRLGAQGG